MEKLYTVSKKQKEVGKNCNSDLQLLIAKFKLKLKKVGKTIRPLLRPKSNPLRLYSGSEK